MSTAVGLEAGQYAHIPEIDSIMESLKYGEGGVRIVIAGPENPADVIEQGRFAKRRKDVQRWFCERSVTVVTPRQGGPASRWRRSWRACCQPWATCPMTYGCTSPQRPSPT